MLDGMQRLDVTLATAPADGNKLTGRVDREMERSLRELVRIRSVSQDKGLREESFRAAKYLARLLESLGATLCCRVPINLSLDLIVMLIWSSLR